MIRGNYNENSCCYSLPVRSGSYIYGWQALKKAGEKLGVEIKVETQGGIGIENVITEADLANTDYVVLTKEVAIKNEERFKGKKIVRVKIADAVKKAEDIVKKLIEHYNSNN